MFAARAYDDLFDRLGATGFEAGLAARGRALALLTELTASGTKLSEADDLADYLQPLFVRDEARRSLFRTEIAEWAKSAPRLVEAPKITPLFAPQVPQSQEGQAKKIPGAPSRATAPAATRPRAPGRPLTQILRDWFTPHRIRGASVTAAWVAGILGLGAAGLHYGPDLLNRFTAQSRIEGFVEGPATTGPAQNLAPSQTETAAPVIANTAQDESLTIIADRLIAAARAYDFAPTLEELTIEGVFGEEADAKKIAAATGLPRDLPLPMDQEDLSLRLIAYAVEAQAKQAEAVAIDAAADAADAAARAVIADPAAAPPPTITRLISKSPK